MNFKYILVTLLFSTTLLAQVAQEVAPPDYIKTITFKGNTAESQLPVLKLGEYLKLEFDALNGDEEDFYYVIEHYNYDWTPSVLSKIEYLDGFDKQRIRTYENSFNTLQIYSNYQLTIPNEQTRRLKVSGNYMLKIYDDYDDLVFSRKFMIYEVAANVGVAIKRSRDVREIESKQTVDITISSTNSHFNNPKQTIKTVIVQNNNLNTAISGIKPMYTLGNELIYKYNTETSFWAGNEYLWFENKDVRAANTGIQFIDLKDLYHNYLYTNLVRHDKPYTYNPDINGNYLVTAIDASNSSIEADYVWMFFSLQLDQLPDGKELHVYGNFNNYTIDETTKMAFNTERGVYKNAILLKQGFYNYKYVVVDKKGNVDEGAISGNFWQAENNYKVLVYYRDLGARYDKIIGLGEASSVNITN
ncbi:type IX secretion system plug protein [Lacinutrix sp. MEBiC02404]